METQVQEIVLNEDFLLRDAFAPGVHRRLIAGLRSMLDRYGDPVITAQEAGGLSRQPEYTDYDVALTIEPGESDGRRLDGHVTWTLHITNSGATRPTGLRTPPSLDLTVWNHEETEATRFRGDLAQPALGTLDCETCVAREVWFLARRIAERAAFALAID